MFYLDLGCKLVLCDRLMFLLLILALRVDFVAVRGGWLFYYELVLGVVVYGGGVCFLRFMCWLIDAL